MNMRYKNKFIFLFLLIIWSCSNVTEFSKEDAFKHPWLKPFLIDKQYLEGKHDLNNDIISITLQNNISYVDSVAYAEDWIMGYNSNKFKILSKNIPYMNGEEGVIILKFEQYNDKTLLYVY